MVTLRKVTRAVLITVSLAVLMIVVMLAWSYRQWEYLPLHGPYSSDLDERSHILQDRIAILTQRVADLELLVLLLLGASGLYSIVFAVSSYRGAIALGRQADRMVAKFKDQLTELQDQVVVKTTAPVGLEEHVAAMSARIASLQPYQLDDQGRLELLHYESALAYVELTGGAEIAPSMARVYRSIAQFYDSRDRARFYLKRALRLSPADSELTSEIHYDLACWYAANNDFEHSTAELAVAFQRPSKILDDRIAQDLEEGGQLFEMANTPPFDKALNDLVLNITVVP